METPFSERENRERNKFAFLCVKAVEKNQEFIIIKKRCLETSSRNVNWRDGGQVLPLP